MIIINVVVVRDSSFSIVSCVQVLKGEKPISCLPSSFDRGVRTQLREINSSLLIC